MIQNVYEVQLNPVGDDRGYLLPIEIGRKEVPFDVKRVYYMYGIPDMKGRGQHAHLDLRQILICVHGSCRVMCDYGDGRAAESYILDRPDKGLVIEGLVWREMGDFTPGTVLLVLADEHYDVAAPKEIRDYQAFLRKVNEEKMK